MNRISRTGLAAIGAVVVVAAGGLGMAYATTPAGSQAQASATPQDDQVQTLNRTAEALNSQAAEVERSLAASASAFEAPEPSEEPSETAEPTGRPTARVEPTERETHAKPQGTHSEADDHEQSDSTPEAQHLETDGAHD